jgi:TolA-binding protein
VVFKTKVLDVLGKKAEKRIRGSGMTKKTWFCFLGMFLLAGGLFSQSQGVTKRIQRGIGLYGEKRWKESAVELRGAFQEAPGISQKVEALFWLSQAELASGDYEAALNDMNRLEELDPTNRRVLEALYQKGRALFYLNRYDEALALLTIYADTIPDTPEESAPAGTAQRNAARKAAALYWIGECLYAQGHLDEAGDVFLRVAQQYPQSAKYEASAYRVALIKQKKVETELLSLLKWSHEEALKNVEDFQRRERSYDQALIAYQKRIADMVKTETALENENAQYQQQVAQAEEKITGLETDLQTTQSSLEELREQRTQDPRVRLQDLKSSAEELKNPRLEGGGGGSSGGESPPAQENGDLGSL